MNTLIFAVFLLGSHPRTDLRVTVYDRAELSQQTKARWLDKAAQIFRIAGIDLTWMEGHLESREAVLMQYPEPPRKGNEVAASCRARVDIALNLIREGPEVLGSSVLGMAVPFASEGLNVLLFIDRLEAVAFREHLPPAALAAHALAHEIGHVLLRSNEHAASGLMAGRWAGHEYGRMEAGVLRFSEAESSRMRMILNRSECESLRTALPPNGPSSAQPIRE